MELYAIQKDFIIPYLEKIENATLNERSAAHTAFGDIQMQSIVAHNENGNEATIAISGPLSPTGPSPLARFFGFGGTGYNEIVAAAQSLELDPMVKNVRLLMDTPGGTIAGMDAARQALVSLASKKTLVAENHGMIESAGYYLATAAPRIKAMSPLAVSGSIGVQLAGIDNSEALARNGLKRIRIVSANAPDKNPDPTTSQGRSVIQDGINAVERIFINTIAEGRNTTVQDVIDNFGRGGELVAQDPDPKKPDALSVGMVDSVVIQGNEVVAEDVEESSDVDEVNARVDNASNRVIPITQNIQTTTAQGGGKPNEGIIMDLKEMKTSHPAIYAQAVQEGITQGKAEGITQERERVDAHLTMGKASGDMEYAVACAKDGTELTASVNAKYMAANMNQKAIGDRGGESEDHIDTPEEIEAANEKQLNDATAAALGVEPITGDK